MPSYLIHRRPSTTVECSENIEHLHRQLNVHRTQREHVLNLARYHRDHIKKLNSLPGKGIASQYIKQSQDHAERHEQTAAWHKQQINRLKELAERQQALLPKLRRTAFRQRPVKPNKAKPRQSKRHRKSQAVNQSGSWWRQMNTKFGTNWVNDYNKNIPVLTPLNQPQGEPEYNSLKQLREANLRFKPRRGQSPLINKLAKRVFRQGTTTNLPPSGVYTNPTVFGVPRSTI